MIEASRHEFWKYVAIPLAENATVMFAHLTNMNADEVFKENVDNLTLAGILHVRKLKSLY